MPCSVVRPSAKLGAGGWLAGAGCAYGSTTMAFWPMQPPICWQVAEAIVAQQHASDCGYCDAVALLVAILGDRRN